MRREGPAWGPGGGGGPGEYAAEKQRLPFQDVAQQVSSAKVRENNYLEETAEGHFLTLLSTPNNFLLLFLK